MKNLLMLLCVVCAIAGLVGCDQTGSVNGKYSLRDMSKGEMEYSVRSGVSVSLLQESTVIDIAATDPLGTYAIESVTPGTYDVETRYLYDFPTSYYWWEYKIGDATTWTEGATGSLPDNPLVFKKTGVSVGPGETVTVDFRVEGY